MKINLQIQLKKVLTYLVIILLTLEISPFILGSFFIEGGYSRKDSLKSLEEYSKTEENPAGKNDTLYDGYLSEHVLHPYLGFVHREESGYNDFGFYKDPPITKRTDSTINICITGGSVAKQLLQISRDELISLLNGHPSFKNKKINLVSVALGGFKQPQQLLALSYLISLGAEYDYVINVDGFNEVVLPYSDNLPFHVFPSFPRHWNIYSRKALTTNMQVILGEQALKNNKREMGARYMAGSVLRYSNFALFTWGIRDRILQGQILDAEKRLRDELSSEGSSFQVQGPHHRQADTTEFFREQARYWAKCSMQMNAIAEYSKASYFHFLQPNQYLEGSKILTREELNIAYEEGDFNYKDAVRKGYPMLIEEGSSLRQAGIHFIDLTQLFSKEDATVYSDKCCHFNKRGYDAIASEIARSITASDD